MREWVAQLGRAKPGGLESVFASADAEAMSRQDTMTLQAHRQTLFGFDRDGQDRQKDGFQIKFGMT